MQVIAPPFVYVTFQPNEVPTDLLEQWSAATKREKHMVSKEPAELLDGALVVVVAFAEGVAIGYGGLFAAYGQDGQWLEWAGLQVVESGSDYVHPDYREHHIWPELVRARVDFARKEGWMVVSVSTNPTVQRGYENMGAMLMPAGEIELRKRLCLSAQPVTGCKFCPFAPRAIWRLT